MRAVLAKRYLKNEYGERDNTILSVADSNTFKLKVLENGRQKIADAVFKRIADDNTEISYEKFTEKLKNGDNVTYSNIGEEFPFFIGTLPWKDLENKFGVKTLFENGPISFASFRDWLYKYVLN